MHKFAYYLCFKCQVSLLLARKRAEREREREGERQRESQSQSERERERERESGRVPRTRRHEARTASRHSERGCAPARTDHFRLTTSV